MLSNSNINNQKKGNINKNRPFKQKPKQKNLKKWITKPVKRKPKSRQKYIVVYSFVFYICCCCCCKFSSDATKVVPFLSSNFFMCFFCHFLASQVYYIVPTREIQPVMVWGTHASQTRFKNSLSFSWATKQFQQTLKICKFLSYQKIKKIF